MRVKGIRVNAVCPAVIDTPMADRAYTDPDRRARAEKLHRVGRFGKVEEVVAAIAWLAGDKAAFVTGTAIPVDGGSRLLKLKAINSLHKPSLPGRAP